MSNTEDRNDETINLDLDEHTSAEDADMDEYRGECECR